jgi:hypothetical protein
MPNSSFFPQQFHYILCHTVTQYVTKWYLGGSLVFSICMRASLWHSDCTVSCTNVLWTDGKNHFIVETIKKAVIVTKTRFWDCSCNDVYNLVLDIPKLFQEIHSSSKSKTSAQEEQPSLSTSVAN